MEIPLFKIDWNDNDITMVSDVIKRGHNWTIGETTNIFEEELAAYLKTKYAVTFNSGTSALHASLLATGIKSQDEVIVPSFTFISTANAPLFIGAKPVFADIEPITYGLDLEDVHKKITSRTRAIIPVHYAGCSCLYIRQLRNLAHDHNIVLIEDAAEAMGATCYENLVGTFGDASVYSFCQNKIITTGEGGCVTTNSEDTYKSLQMIRSHGRSVDSFTKTTYNDYTSLGYNFRLSDIASALGLSQLRRINKIIDKRTTNAEYLTYLLSGISAITPLLPPYGCTSVYQLYTIYVDDDRDNLMRYLQTNGIASKIYFEPIHLTPFYNSIGYNGYTETLPVTERISQNIMSLPMYTSMTPLEIEYIYETISDFFKIVD